MSIVLVERDAEIEAISAAVRDTERDDGSTMVISGPVGIGRTALLQLAQEIALREGALALSASAAESERGFVFGVLRQLFDPVLFGASDPERAGWFEDLPDAVRALLTDSVPSDAFALDATAELVLHGLHALVLRIAAGRPAVVLLDDLHLADEPSLRWIGYLTSRPSGSRLLVVATVCDGDPYAELPLIRQVLKRAQRVLRPERLSRPGCGALVRRLCEGPAEDEFTAACHELSGGIPLFATAVLAAAATVGCQSRAADVGRLTELRPLALRMRLESSLNRHSADALAYLRAIDVLGEHTELVAQLTGFDQIGAQEIARELAAQGLLVLSGGRPRFVHPCLRDAVEVRMTAEERQQLHLAAAALLYRMGHSVELVATQLLAVTSSPELPWTVEALRSAAAAAGRRGAPVLASRYLRRALMDIPTDGQDRSDVLLDLAVAERATEPAALVAHVLRAATALDSPVRRAAAITRIPPSLLDAAPGQVRDLIEELSQELRATAEPGGPEQELVWLLEAHTRISQDLDSGGSADAADRLRELDLDTHLDSSGGRELLASLLHGATVTATVPAQEVAAQADLLLNREPAVAEHVYTVLPSLVLSVALTESMDWLGDWLRTADEQAAQGGDPAARAIIGAERAVWALSRGRHDEAVARAEEFAALLPPGWTDAVAGHVVMLMAAAVEIRDVALADRMAELSSGEHPGVPAMRRMQQGLHAMERGENELALQNMLACGAQLDRIGWRNPALVPWRGWVAGLRHQLGQTGAAIALVEEELALARDWGAPGAIGRSLRTLGSLTPGPEGATLLHNSMHELERSVNQVEQARTHLALAERLGTGAGAQEHRRSAARIAHLCGVLGLLRQNDAVGEAQSAPALTRAEQRVVNLAVAGHTNQAIADELGVSTRAVEKHLTNSYRKLGVSGRPELVATWQEQRVEPA